MSTCLIVGLVLVALSIPIGGVLLALGVYGVRKYVASAKTIEAKNTISQIARLAAAAYERESMDDPVHPAAASHAAGRRLCGSAVAVPAAVPKGVKYMPSSADFSTGDAHTGWTCLKFSMNSPSYYQYMYEKGAGSGKSGASATGFEASARGDLDGNGVTSFFARSGDVKNGSVMLTTEIYIENEFE
jgi:type IV pilus assembly protein PilA